MNKPTPIFHDDQLLEGVARRITSDINQFFSRERVERMAALDERIRLARELHDGLLQSLTAAALQLQALSRIVDQNPRGVQKRIRDLEAMIAEEHRELRAWIDTLEPNSRRPMASAADLRAALETLCRRLETQWDLRITLSTGERGAVPRTLGDEIYRVVQEGVNNVGRHSGSRTAEVDVFIGADDVTMQIVDRGTGFPYFGSFDLSALEAGGLGPRSLRERVAACNGQLTLLSRPTGARLNIVLPLSRSR